MSYPKSILYFVLALALIRGIIYASVVPPWQAPDEPPQFERAKAALTNADWVSDSQNPTDWYQDIAKSLFAFDFFDFLDTSRPEYSPDEPITRYTYLYQEIYGNLYGSRIMYALIGWPLSLTDFDDITLQLYLIRINTVLMNVAIIFLAFLLTKTIFPNAPFMFWGVPILLLFMPQHTHLLSTVNNGNLAELLATIALYFIVRGFINGFSWQNIGLILVFSLAAMWTKATAYFLLVALGVMGLFFLWKYRRYWRRLLPAGIILALLTYIFAPERLKLLIPSAWTLLQTRGFYLDPIVPKDLFRSFWAMPGWTIFYIHPMWYYLLITGCVLAIVGLIILVIKKWPLICTGQYTPQIRVLTVMLVAIVASITVLLIWNGLNHSIVYRQGRSIYPVIICISIFLLLGWRQIIPYGWRKIGLLSITLAFFLFDSLVLFNYLIPIFYSRY